MKLRILSAQDVKDAIGMSEAIKAMRVAFGEFSSGKAMMPLRSRFHVPDGITLMMPAFLPSIKAMGIKVVSVFEKNPSLGLPVVGAIVIVLNPDTGFPLAVINGASLTALRTGAAGGLAADLLSRKDSKTIALFGAGVQARAQLEGVLTVRSISSVKIFDRVRASAEKLAEEILGTISDVSVVGSPKEAVSDADIVITATTSTSPVFDGGDLKPGTHVTGVGSFTPQMQEIDEKTIRRARVVVDSKEACMAETGDIILSNASISAEIGEIVNGKKPGRQNDEEITFFKSVGLAVQDAAAAAAVLRSAEENGLGMMVEL